MSDDKHERIRRRAYEIWEREGQTHGLHERHWNQATFEIENEDRSLGARPPVISGADVPAPAQTQSRAKKGKRATGIRRPSKSRTKTARLVLVHR
ncbi:DUF2934 domain-containing protein [Mesorhizobium onobrychidis]|uniref:DUF2934 domain-containing protein n=1 Tax=Mesorhizobium onobrychidis TaxID=2775404 RepID=A0ABY5R9T1_9HYPH|nr:DUF2934 domain-containing protein [Mesorhizobium onobrychidis]UVC19397.1 DUF2934 domain-containing protein [Mesorhizobium onobrychidis]